MSTPRREFKTVLDATKHADCTAEELDRAFKRDKSSVRINRVDEQKSYTPLMWAAFNGNEAAVEWLLDESKHPGHPVKLRAENKGGNTALAIAFNNEKKNIQVVNRLLFYSLATGKEFKTKELKTVANCLDFISLEFEEAEDNLDETQQAEQDEREKMWQHTTTFFKNKYQHYFLKKAANRTNRFERERLLEILRGLINLEVEGSDSKRKSVENKEKRETFTPDYAKSGSKIVTQDDESYSPRLMGKTSKTTHNHPDLSMSPTSTVHRLGSRGSKGRG